MPDLATFPVDDHTLDLLTEALDTSIGHDDDGNRINVGGDFTMSQLLDFFTGYDPTKRIPLGLRPDPTGLSDTDVEWFQYPEPVFTETDVIRALVSEVRRLRATPDPQETP